MKKTLSLLAVFLLTITFVNAQTELTQTEVNGSTAAHNCKEEIAYISPQTGQVFNRAEFKEAIIHMLKTRSCEYKGIKLYGKVKFVTSFPDIKIKYVTSFPDIKVKFVSSFPDKCGKWKKVTSFQDFKVQVVTSFPDLKVKKVDSFPGMN